MSEKRTQATTLDELAGLLGELIAQLRGDLDGPPRLRLPAAYPVPVVARAASNSTQLTTVPNTLHGFALRETTGAARAVIELRAGESDDGALVAAITLAAGESVRDWFGPNGIAVSGLRLVRVSGSADGSVFLGGGG